MKTYILGIVTGVLICVICFGVYIGTSRIVINTAETNITETNTENTGSSHIKVETKKWSKK
ncbi:MAG: hypothetical protein J1F01_05480 [Oscillospiraceae bacterium]|nr:hypothetical protein [Oscillospiraceae bacterium]